MQLCAYMRYIPHTINSNPRETTGMTIDLDSFDWTAYTVGELQQIADDIANEIQTKREAKKHILLQQFQELLSAEGLTLDDVIGAKRRGRPRKRGTPPVRFRDPDTGKGWSGRGRKPIWLTEKLQAGARLEDFAVEHLPAEDEGADGAGEVEQAAKTGSAA
jgi:DNA-binding protein H-NS